MKIKTNLLKDSQDEKLVKTTAAINESNPMVDRIMEDDSVEGVIMTNKEGAPIWTNVIVTHATLLYGKALRTYSMMARMYMKELDVFDDISVIRIITKKNEIILAPDPEFLIIVIQHARKIKAKDKAKRKLIFYQYLREPYTTRDHPYWKYTEYKLIKDMVTKFFGNFHSSENRYWKKFAVIKKSQICEKMIAKTLQ